MRQLCVEFLFFLFVSVLVVVLVGAVGAFVCLFVCFRLVFVFFLWLLAACVCFGPVLVAKQIEGAFFVLLVALAVMELVASLRLG